MLTIYQPRGDGHTVSADVLAVSESQSPSQPTVDQHVCHHRVD